MWKIGETSIVLIQGDITESDVDAIVNAANTKLILGDGVAGAIRKKGGPVIQQECSKIGSIELGQAAITTGGNLKAKYVIHAASMNLGGKTTELSLRSAILNSLMIGKHNNIQSIAFPAIGTGIAGFQLKRCAEIMIECFTNFLKDETSEIKQIQVVLFTESDFTIFNHIFNIHINEYQ
ncbi:MAG: O-acetyl-ADP-ribose deacetylase [Candidatus Heimdallarchaeota archaeon]|nr:O-acetyl-ADP-ribose deacetylase [Candidatus Heimdallarchaeota archaeon]